jgi:hypothetical protein
MITLSGLGNTCSGIWLILVEEPISIASKQVIWQFKHFPPEIPNSTTLPMSQIWHKLFKIECA